MKGSIARIIDANMNRITEGLRVIEELFRFYLNDLEKTKFTKHIRHDIVKILKKTYDNIELYLSRDIVRDVGTEIKSDDELVRSGIEEIFLTNAGRVKEGLRVVEEYLKTIFPNEARKIEKLRYEFYDFEREVAIILKRKEPEFYRSHIGFVINPNDDLESAISHIKSNNIRIVKCCSLGDEEKFIEMITRLQRHYDGYIYIEDSIKIGLITRVSGILLTSKLPMKELVINLKDHFIFGSTLLQSDLQHMVFIENGMDHILKELKHIEKLKIEHPNIRLISQYNKDNEKLQLELFKKDIIDILLFNEKNLTKNENIIKITKE